MFGDYSVKEMLLWIGGVMVVGAIVILGTIWEVNALLRPTILTIGWSGKVA